MKDEIEVGISRSHIKIFLKDKMKQIWQRNWDIPNTKCRFHSDCVNTKTMGESWLYSASNQPRSFSSILDTFQRKRHLGEMFTLWEGRSRQRPLFAQLCRTGLSKTKTLPKAEVRSGHHHLHDVRGRNIFPGRRIQRTAANYMMCCSAIFVTFIFYMFVFLCLCYIFRSLVKFCIYVL